jgi:hypothetical protein
MKSEYKMQADKFLGEEGKYQQISTYLCALVQDTGTFFSAYIY